MILPISTFDRMGKKWTLSLVQYFDQMFIATYWDYSHLAKLANWDTPGIWPCFAEGHLVYTFCLYNPKMKISLTKDVPFLHKSYGEWCKVEKPVKVPTSYDWTNDDDKDETVSENNQNNNYYAPNTTVNAKVLHAMRYLQASYTKDANEIIDEVTQEKSAKENHFFDWLSYYCHGCQRCQAVLWWALDI